MIDLSGLTGFDDRVPRRALLAYAAAVGLARALAVDPEIMFFPTAVSPFSPPWPAHPAGHAGLGVPAARRVRQDDVFSSTHDCRSACASATGS